MSRIVLVLLAVLVLIAETGAPPPCGQNEVFTTCGTAYEEPSCANPNIASSPYCRRGCQCKGGYLRNAVGACIHPTECNPHGTSITHTVDVSVSSSTTIG